ncbi:MAG: zinc-ribbon domain containing protein [Ruminococcus sp.]|nr:zinc-ribbon domain containing protein [Ruminococcus sp.]
MYEDKILVCKDCGSEFTFTAGEQEFFAEKGFTNEPQRCKACRIARKNGGSVSKPAVELFEATCSKCGGIARVRFQPKEGRPVYCGKCFAEMRNY